LVVDDGSQDGTREVVGRFSSVRYFRQDQSGPGQARNLGGEKAKAQIVLYLDADLGVPPDLLSRHLEFHQRHPEACAAGGAVLPDSPPRLFSWKMADHLSSWFNAHPGCGPTKDNEYLPSLNFSVNKRKILEQDAIRWIGGLEHTGEDVVFCAEIRACGHRLHFLPEAVVHHRDRESAATYFKHMYNWGYHAPFVRGRLTNVSYGFLFPRRRWGLLLSLPAIVMGYTFLVWKNWLRSRPLAATLALPQIFLGRLAYARGVWDGTNALLRKSGASRSSHPQKK